MNYLVTGAAGFIGSKLAEELVSNGNRVVTVDNLSTGYLENIPQGCESIIGDLHDKEVIKKLEKYKFDAIYHIAGQSGGMTSFDDPIYDMNSNITSTLLLMELCRKTGCNNFIYASSMSIYGDENPVPVYEESNIKPKTFYAVGKLASEHYLRIYSQEFGIKTTALRFNNTYGPGQNMKNLRQGMVSIFIAQAIKDKHIHVMGAAERFRDFVHVDDVVKACIKSAEAKDNAIYSEYNISTNIKTTVRELVEEIKRNIPYNISVEYKGSTQGDQYGIYCDYSKINKELGWKPEISFKNGIKEMVEWALSSMEN